MTFAHPWVLLLLLLPLALAAWEINRRGFTVPMPFDHRPHHRRPWMGRLLLASALLPAIVLAGALLILAGPRRLGPPGQERVLTNIEICLDVSGSMSAQMGGVAADGKPASRYTVSMDAINHFTTRREGDAFGLTIFGGEVVRWVPLTQDLSAIRNATPFLDPRTLPSPLNATRIGNALRFCGRVLTRQPEGDRLIILISDGFSSDLGGGRAQEVAGELRASEIVVHAIHVGEGPAPAQLADVVTPTGGQVFSARDRQGLDRIFEHIDRMQPARIKPTQPEPIDFFTPFALAGLAVLGAHGLTLFGLRYTPW